MNSSLDSLAETMKLLSDKTRLTILSLLKEQELCVCDIVDIMETTQPNISQHLKKLKLGGLVIETRRSQWSYYSLQVDDKPYVKAIIEELPSMKHKLATRNPECCK